MNVYVRVCMRVSKWPGAISNLDAATWKAGDACWEFRRKNPAGGMVSKLAGLQAGEAAVVIQVDECSSPIHDGGVGGEAQSKPASRRPCHVDNSSGLVAAVIR